MPDSRRVRARARIGGEVSQAKAKVRGKGKERVKAKAKASLTVRFHPQFPRPAGYRASTGSVVNVQDSILHHGLIASFALLRKPD